jgi:phosphate starvation-inducible PhoH-like protein
MEITIELNSQEEALALFGTADSHLKLIRETLPVTLHARNGTVRIVGEDGPVEDAARILRGMLERFREGAPIPPDYVERQLERLRTGAKSVGESGRQRIKFELEPIEHVARSPGQQRYMQSILENDVVFCIGPAGTGKTYLAVQMAVGFLRGGDIRKIILCRPAVEAGEKLGFLPGDFQAKINPYLRPLYDALNEILDYEKVKRYLEREIIEVIPLAYMRGRTLNNAFIILDEGQNTTVSQMKMFLTRMGMMSKILVNGDITQMDLPHGVYSGLVHVRKIMRGVKGIGWIELEKEDIVRHPLVKKILALYEGDENHGRHQNPQ